MADSQLITNYLRRVSSGDRSAEEPLADAVYVRMIELGRAAMAGRSAPMSVQPTALVNEVLMELVRIRGVEWQDRAHFYRVASRLLRRRLIDHIRAKRAQKRFPESRRSELNEALLPVESRFDEILMVHDGLNQLAEFDEPLAELIEMVYFGGISLDEAARIRGVTRRTISRHLDIGRRTLNKIFGASCLPGRESDAITFDRS